MTRLTLPRALAAAFALSLVWMSSALATPNILIFADDPTTATSSCEYKIVTSGTCGTTVGLGWTATVVATGTAATQPYGNYDAVLLSSCCTYGGLSTFSAAGGPTANAMTWGGAVTGNVVIIGTDPNVHTGAGTGGPQLIKSALQFAAAGAKPGAVVIMNGLYYNAAPNTLVPVLAGFESTSGGKCGTGKFGVQKTNLDTVHKIATHPALAGLTDAVLSNWMQSSHNGFNCWPASFTPLAILTDLPGGDPRLIWTGTDTETGASVTGFPYILARGVTPSGPPKPIDCCTPLDKAAFDSMLSEAPTGGINAPYIVRFGTNPTFDLQMQSFYGYVSAMDPTVTGVDIFLLLINCNDNAAPVSIACPSGSIMSGFKMLTWNALSATSSTPNAPWRSEWVLPSLSTNSCSPSFSSNCIAWSSIFSTAEQSAVNHRYEIIAMTVVEHADGTRAVLDKCPILMHQVNHMQSLLTATLAIDLRAFAQTPVGKRALEAFANAARSVRPPPAIRKIVPQQEPPHDHH